jgi:hypothetical protein
MARISSKSREAADLGERVGDRRLVGRLGTGRKGIQPCYAYSEAGFALRAHPKESDAQVKFGVGNPEDFRLSTHGTTSLSSIEHSGEILKADILVHPKPQVWAPRKKQGSKEYEQVQRDAGDGVRLVIIAHEFVHACGLEKHSNNESQDVFYSPLEPNGGDKPQDDYMKVPIKGGIRLPPIVLSAQTARRLRDVWQ